jgi:hypothetical protein
VRKPDWNTESGHRSMIIVTYGVPKRTRATMRGVLRPGLPADRRRTPLR